MYLFISFVCLYVCILVFIYLCCYVFLSLFGFLSYLIDLFLHVFISSVRSSCIGGGLEVRDLELRGFSLKLCSFRFQFSIYLHRGRRAPKYEPRARRPLLKTK